MAPRAIDLCQETVGYLIKPTTTPARARSLAHTKYPSVVERHRTGVPTMKKTSKKAQEFTGRIGMKVAAFSRQKFPRNAAKALASEFNVAVPTAKGWLAGKCPATAHLMSMWAHWGRAFFCFVFDDMDADLAEIARLKAEVADLEKKIHRVSQDIEAHGKAFNPKE